MKNNKKKEIYSSKTKQNNKKKNYKKGNNNNSKIQKSNNDELIKQENFVCGSITDEGCDDKVLINNQTEEGNNESSNIESAISLIGTLVYHPMIKEELKLENYYKFEEEYDPETLEYKNDNKASLTNNNNNIEEMNISDKESNLLKNLLISTGSKIYIIITKEDNDESKSKTQKIKDYLKYSLLFGTYKEEIKKEIQKMKK